MFFEPDLMHRHVACKCFQCGYIAAYLRIEPGEAKPQFEIAGRIGSTSMLVEDDLDSPLRRSVSKRSPKPARSFRRGVFATSYLIFHRFECTVEASG